MTDIFGDGEGFIDINEAMGVKSSASLNREFKPWHKPRKQLIRDWQWWEHIERLINDTSYSAIKYFGLPGGDLLDLEYFSKKLSETEKTKDTILFAYGFVNNESTKRQAEERLSKLLDKENVCDRSKIDKFSFQSISTEGSESRARLIENSPYHFFNIDLCNNIISKDYIDALRTLLTVQSRQAQSLTWLLSITTRNNGSSLQSNAYCILKAIAKNIDEEVIEK
ncbi:MAG: hypothetical protein NE328_21595, partial [Lentisphaeraceae bacterium]|nr:hypothetical protein [Lentisphaeraceae bacterium]